MRPPVEATTSTSPAGGPLAGGVSAWFSKTRCGPHGAFLGRSSMFRTGPPLGGSVTYKVFFGTSSHVDPVFAKGESAREVARPTLVQHPQVRRSATPWCRRCLGGSASPPSCCRGRPWRCRMPIDVRPCRLLHLHKWFPSGPWCVAAPRSPGRLARPRPGCRHVESSCPGCDGMCPGAACTTKRGPRGAPSAGGKRRET